MPRTNRRTRFQPRLETLEDRLAPALTVLAAHGDLTLTGTPTATTVLEVQNVGGNNYQVTDGSTDLGTYQVTHDIRLRLDSIDNDVLVDLAGSTLPGSVLIDIGSGDRDPSTLNSVKLTSSSAGGKVLGDVTFNGGSGEEGWALGGALEVSGKVRATSVPVTAAIEDSFLEDKGVTVHGSLTTTRLSYTLIAGVVDGNVTAQTTDSPAGMGLEVSGTIHGNLRATGAATAPGCYSYAYLFETGTIDGNVNVNVTDGSLRVKSVGTIGGSASFDLAGGSASVDSDLKFGGSIGHDLHVHADAFSNAQRISVAMQGGIGGSVFLDLNGAPQTFILIQFSGNNGNIGGDLNVTSHGGQFAMYMFPTGFAPPSIGGNLNVQRTDGGYVGMQSTVIAGSASLEILGSSANSSNLIDDFAQVGGDLKVHMDTGGDLDLQYATVGGSADVNLGGSPNGYNFFSSSNSTIAGSLNVSSGSGLNFSLGGDPAAVGGDVHLRVAGDSSLLFGGAYTIGGDVNIHLGDGSNYLGIDGTSGGQIGGIVRYQGGTGPDTIAISGQNTFRLIAHTGGGDDTVTFDPDARVESALIDFGATPGNKSWVPPTVIDFPLVLL